jgi:hypothetical protein
MGQVHPLPKPPSTDDAPIQNAGSVTSIDSTHCGLCGAKLSSRSLRHRVVSPQSSNASMTVCHTCHKAALGEGYRPVH